MTVGGDTYTFYIENIQILSNIKPISSVDCKITAIKWTLR